MITQTKHRCHDEFAYLCLLIYGSKFGFDASFLVIFLSLTNLTSTLFEIFSIVFPKTELFISLKKSFSKSFFAFALDFVLRLIHFSNMVSHQNLFLCESL